MQCDNSFQVIWIFHYSNYQIFHFSNYQSTQVVDNCCKLFSVKDVQNCVEISLTEYAQSIVVILHEVFQDMYELIARILMMMMNGMYEMIQI